MEKRQPSGFEPDPKADAMAHLIAVSYRVSSGEETDRQDEALLGEMESILTESPTPMPYPPRSME